MERVWYYSKDIYGECSVVYANGKNTSSRHWFRATNGRFVDAVNGEEGSSFSQAVRLDFYSAHRLGSLNGRPNLQDAVRKGRLPDDVLGELQRIEDAWRK
jgi:hypothetical protein